MKALFGFIGMGNMGYAMLKGALRNFDKNEIIFTDINKKRMEEVSQETGVSYVSSNAECANNVRYLVLAVKPQFYKVVLDSIKYVVRQEQIVISIAPGISVEYLKSQLGEDRRIVRAMPNTPALIGEGMTGICYDEKSFTEDEIQVIHTFFDSFGKAKKVPEGLMNTVVCVSGSSPAYVYMFIEALADSAVKYGMSRADAYEFAAQSVMGSAKMVLETKMHPGQLKDNVCSPAGTTIAAVAALEECGFRNSVFKATDACYRKCEGK